MFFFALAYAQHIPLVVNVSVLLLFRLQYGQLEVHLASVHSQKGLWVVSVLLNSAYIAEQCFKCGHSHEYVQTHTYTLSLFTRALIKSDDKPKAQSMSGVINIWKPQKIRIKWSCG